MQEGEEEKAKAKDKVGPKELVVSLEAIERVVHILAHDFADAFGDMFDKVTADLKKEINVTGQILKRSWPPTDDPESQQWIENERYKRWVKGHPSSTELKKRFDPKQAHMLGLAAQVAY